MLLDRNQWFVRERAGLLKLSDTYDILDVESGEAVGLAQERPATWTKLLRLVGAKKRNLPTVVHLCEADGSTDVVVLRKRFSWLRTRVDVTLGDGQALGHLKTRLFAWKAGFDVFGNGEAPVARVQGDWKGWSFTIATSDGAQLGTITKQWAGLGKELFTSADNYVVSLAGLGDAGVRTKALLLAAAIAVDVVFHERG